MPRLLHIDASPRAERSRSRPVAQAFLDALGDGWQVETLLPFEEKLPALGGDMIEGRYAMLFGEEVAPGIASAWDEVREAAERFMQFDGIVISTPMWNFGLPYALKHYIDVITQPGMLFRNDAQGNVEGLAAGKRALLIGASAMPFGKDEGLAALDFQVAYLERWMDFIGLSERAVIRVSPTFGAPEDVEAEMARAIAEAREKAAGW